NYLQSLLIEGLGLSISSLSSKGFSCLNALVDSAVILEMKDTSLTSFFCAINHLSSELYATKSKNKKLEVELNDMTRKLTEALMLEKRLKEDLKKSEEILETETNKADRQIHNLKFLENKSKDMNLRVKAAEEQLTATGLDRSLTHESLVNLSKELAELRNEIVPLKKKLGFYLDLAPNPTLARVKIEEVKRELDAVEAELSKEIDMLTLELPKPSRFRFT
ncbi:HAUS augmin-like complex subunit 1, partial [Antrostomus carolinensis]|uniref:HAUS augmin-like complex subunit 1 n=1 Tax=Antrostomus carolinensis TaxID=279965 RepID=UPI0005289639